MKRIKARIKTAEEITGVETCNSFRGRGFVYDSSLNDLAKSNTWIEVYKIFNCQHTPYNYKMCNGVYVFKKEWIREEKEV